MKRGLAIGLAAGVMLLTAPRQSQAFCGFYVAPTDAPLVADATMVSLMRQGSRTAITMSNNYKGPAADFAMVVPVPVVLQKEMVKTLPPDVFQKLEALSAPRLVEYWEQDPCYEPPQTEGKHASKKKSDAPGSGGSAQNTAAVKIEAQFAVGEYEVVVLSATESDALEKWLIDNKYNIPKGASSALAPYIKEQQKFFVAKIDITKVKLDDKGVAVLSPLRFHYESSDFRLPVRLGLLNAQGKQDLIVYVLATNQRYEVANYPNVTAPTNIDVSDETRNSFNSFYAALFDATVEKSGGKAIVTEYAWMSNSCDPCPTPPLGDREISLLGGDALLGMASADGDAGAGVITGNPGGGYYGGGSSIVLTRLHARYDATTLTEDLVFRAAQPIVGGREFVVDQATGALEKGAQGSSMNNFQARYAIRHPWSGAIACAKPRRGVWGGKPGGYAPPLPPATGLAAAKRDVQLSSYIVSSAADLGIKLDAPPAGAKPPPPPPAPFPWGWLAVAGALVVVISGAAYAASRKYQV